MNPMIPLLFVLLTVGVASQSLPTVHVFTRTDPSGLTDANQVQRQESVRLIKESLRGKKNLRLAEDENTADVLIEVLGSAKKDTGTEQTMHSGFGISTTKKQTRPAIHIDLRAGEYSVQMEAAGARSWKRAAEGTANAIEKWIKQNQQALVRR